MGIEFFLLILLAIIAVGAGIFFSGSFGVAKAKAGGERENRPTHAYVENETDERLFGVDRTDEVRRTAEDDPNTEVRT